jgi:hypothetical protein
VRCSKELKDFTVLVVLEHILKRFLLLELPLLFLLLKLDVGLDFLFGLRLCFYVFLLVFRDVVELIWMLEDVVNQSLRLVALQLGHGFFSLIL